MQFFFSFFLICFFFVHGKGAFYVDERVEHLTSRLNPNVNYSLLPTWENVAAMNPDELTQMLQKAYGTKNLEVQSLNSPDQRAGPGGHAAGFGARSGTGRIHVGFVGGLPEAAVQNVFIAAAFFLQSYFVLSADVNVAVEWVDLSSVPNLLGEGGPSTMCPHPDSGAYPFVLIPAALYVHLTGADNCPGMSGSIHVHVQLNSQPNVPWYFGVDGQPPVNRIDLVTVVMHELLHGLGFLSGVAGAGAQYPFAPYGYVFDWYVFYSNNVTGWPSTFAGAVSDPCIANPLLLSNGALIFRGVVGNASIESFTLYSPTMFAPGSSVSHVAPVAGSSANRLMQPSIQQGHAWHDIGANVWEAMASMGYDMVDSSYLLPYDGAELAQMEVSVSSEAGSLSWFILSS